MVCSNMFTQCFMKNTLFIILIFFMKPATYADTTDQYIELSAGYSRGEFNLGQDADLYRLQLVYGEVHSDYDLSVTAPYLKLKDNTGNYSGFGDVIVRMGKGLNASTSSDEGFYGSVALKIPTASESGGLGTGQWDLGGFLSYSHKLHEMNLTIMGGYILTGDRPGIKYEDVFVYGIGLSKFITPWYFFGSVEGQQKTIAAEADSLDLNAGLFYRLKADQFLKAEGFIGLNSTTPDYGISVGIVNWF